MAFWTGQQGTVHTARIPRRQASDRRGDAAHGQVAGHEPAARPVMCQGLAG
jgi:hypothetical protein